MIRAKHATATVPKKDIQAPVLIKRIGSTTFTVNIHFSKTGKETAEDKIFRLIKREVEQSA